MNVIYVSTVLLCGFFGSLMVDIVDVKSDIAAGFRTAPIRKKKR